jgi:hypothetical protein
MSQKKGYDFTKRLDTRGTARRTSQEQIDAARKLAAGRPAPPYDPVLHAKLGREIIDTVKRTVIGLAEVKGRAPTYKLSHDQFAEFTETGAWSGEPRMPTPEEYGPHSAVPEDKEYQ